MIFWYRKILKVAIFWDGCGNNFDGYYIRCFFFPCVIYSYGSLSVIAATTACNKLEPGRGRASEHGLQQHVATVVAASTYSTATRSAILTVQMYTDLCWLFRDCCAQRSPKFSGVGLRGLLLLLLHIEKGRVMGYCTGAVETSMFVCTCIMASSPVTMHVHTVWIARSGTAWSGCALRDQWPCFYGDTDTIWKKLQAIINSVLLAASPANQQYFSLTPNQHQPASSNFLS